MKISRSAGFLFLPALAILCLLIAQGCKEEVRSRKVPPDYASATLQVTWNEKENQALPIPVDCQKFCQALVEYTNNHKGYTNVTCDGHKIPEPDTTDKPCPVMDGVNTRPKVAQNAGFADGPSFMKFLHEIGLN